jgi:hypothetical protein
MSLLILASCGNPIPKCEDKLVEDTLIRIIAEEVAGKGNENKFNLISTFEIVTTKSINKLQKTCYAQIKFTYPNSYGGENEESIVGSDYTVELNDAKKGEFFVTAVNKLEAGSVSFMHYNESTFLARMRAKEDAAVRERQQEEERRNEENAEQQRIQNLEENPFNSFTKEF